MSAVEGFHRLTPARVLDALDAVGLQPDGRLLQLNSYENRVHQAFLEDGTAVVTKFYRPRRWSDAQILEEHGFALELAAAEVSVVAPIELTAPSTTTLEITGSPPTLARWSWRDEVHRFAVWPRRAGRAPELEDGDTLFRLGRFIGRMHAVGRRRPFEHRLRMDPARDGPAAIDTLVALGCLAEPQKSPWLGAARQAVDLMVQAFDAVDALATLRLHGDCHLGNLLWRDGQVNGVDLDDACMGPAIQDLWMMVSGDAPRAAAQLETLVAGYSEWMELDPRERGLIEPLRTLRMIRHSAWLAQRWDDPAFPAAFPFFGTEAYWSQQVSQLREQIELMSTNPWGRPASW